MNTATSTGSSIRRKLFIPRAWRCPPPLASRLIITNMSTGIPMVPKTPIGSRRKILISSQVSFRSPRMSVANQPAGELEIRILERRHGRAEVGDPDAVLGDASDHIGHQILTRSLNGDPRAVDRDLRDPRDRSKTVDCLGIVGNQYDGPFGAVPRDQPLGTVDLDDPPMLDDCHPIAEALGLFHH